MPHEREVMRRRPPLDERDLFFIDAWNDLSSERALGFGGLGDVPLRAITHWADLHGLDHEATMLLIAVIRRLDSQRNEREASERLLKDKGGKS